MALPAKNFAFGEYTHVFRLTSELADLQAGYANPFPRLKLGKRVRSAGISKSPPPGRAEVFLALPARNFAFGEYTRAFRLTSELVDLQAGYANPFPRLRLGKRVRSAGISKSPPPGRAEVFLALPARIELTTNP